MKIFTFEPISIKHRPMSFPLNQLMITIVYSGEEYKLKTFHGEYRDLKTLIMDRLFPEDFGQCGGMGRCATCLVEIKGMSAEDAQMKRNESVTLGKIGMNKPEIRLACQIPVDSSLADVKIRILE